MKKLTTILAVILAVSMFAACTSKPATSSSTPNTSSSTPNTSSSAPADKVIEGDLSELITTLYEGVPEDKMVGTMETPITSEMSVNYTGVEATAYKEAVASDAAINAQAHSVVLMRANSVEEAIELAKAVEEKADPRKWICVEAEKKIVDRVGDTVILIMTFEDIADTIHQNFLNLAK